MKPVTELKHLRPELGLKIGKLTLVKCLGKVNEGDHHKTWRGLCECGNHRDAKENNLRLGSPSSCGACEPAGPHSAHCKCCKELKPRAGSKQISGMGLCCADCVASGAVQIPAPAPKKVKLAKPRADHIKDLGPWPGHTTQQPPTAPAQRAEGDHVIRDDGPRLGKFGVDASEVVPYFSTLGIGRYQRSSSWAEHYLAGGRA